MPLIFLGKPTLPSERSLLIFQFSVLASGSKGNAVYIENGASRILLDAGLGIRSLTQRMESLGRSLDDLTAVFLTHEHSDHIKAAGALSRKYKLPIYGTRGTFEKVKRHLPPSADWRFIERPDEIRLGALEVSAYPTPHDGQESVAFTVRCEDKKLGHATDLGSLNKTVVESLSNCDALLVEANHDPTLLEQGPYPWLLKQRIKSDVGHLSNQECGRLLSHVKNDRLQHVVLMHLSECNNTPEKAYEVAQTALHDSSAEVRVSGQHCATPLIPVE